MKTCAFKTLGCKVNQYETQAIRENLRTLGFEEVGENDKPDLYIINTCTVTGRGDSDSRRAIQKAHRISPRSSIVVTGCYAKGNEWLDNANGVKLIIENGSKNRIAKLITNIPKRRQRIIGEDPDGIFGLKISGFEGRSKAYIKIQDGCSYRCSYCKIPSVRGRSKSRPSSDIIDEAKRLLDNNFKELILTGISLGSYPDLVRLLKRLAALKGEFRIRISSIEPADVTKCLIDALADHSNRICGHFHIPLQSGDDGVLKAMRRSYTSSRYLMVIDSIRRRIPHAAITLDLIVGFPTETDRAFENSLKALKQIAPSRGHVFTYSPREGTPAYRLRDLVPERAKHERSKAAKEALSIHSLNYRKGFVGKQLRVLVETERSKTAGLLTGYSDNYIKVDIKDGNNLLMNTLVGVDIIEANLNGTYGNLITYNLQPTT